jgi:hypothetical protein
VKRIIITLVASAAVLAVAPAVALGHHHHSAHKLHHAKRHARIRHRTFGSDDPTTSSASPDNAGTVDTFSNGVLTITLNDGTTVTGHVTNATELECTSSSNTMGMDGDTSGDDNGGSSSGDDNGGSSSGDDNGRSATTTNSGDNDANEDQNEDVNEDQNEDEQGCSTASLTHGTVVREAELNIGSGGAIWHQVELITS